MIVKEFELFLLSYLDYYLILVEDVVIFVDMYNVDYVMLLLVSNGFLCVLVIIKEKKYVGIISILDIMGY